MNKVALFLPAQALRALLPAAAILWTGAWTFALYFGVWANDPRTYEEFGTPATHLAGAIAQRSEPRMFFAFHDRWPVQLLAPRTAGADWYREDITAIPVPTRPDAGALYVAAPGTPLAGLTAAGLPQLQPVAHTSGPGGAPDFLAFSWPAPGQQALTSGMQKLDVPMLPDFRLAGYVFARQRPASSLSFVWQPLTPSGPYDLYVHVLDASGKQVLQSDALAWPAEDGPSDYLLLTHVDLPLPAARYKVEAGAVHRSPKDPAQLVGGPIGQVATFDLDLTNAG